MYIDENTIKCSFSKFGFNKSWQWYQVQDKIK